jgi:hypothetical protein
MSGIAAGGNVLIAKLPTAFHNPGSSGGNGCPAVPKARASWHAARGLGRMLPDGAQNAAEAMAWRRAGQVATALHTDQPRGQVPRA